MKEISEKTIEKISQTKLEGGRKKIMEGFIKNDIPEQHDNKLAIPSHRTREQISFNQFKEFISQGKSLQELCKLYSKHLMAFYSYLSKGKITLTKEQFEEEYNKGIPLDEIGRSHNIPREYITYLREYYGIKRKGAKYQKRLQNEVPLSQEAKDVIIGSLLGDGYIDPDGYFTEKHSEKQVEYLEWKAEFLKPILTPKSFSVYCRKDNRYPDSISYAFCLRTIVHSYINEMRNKFYKKIGEKFTKIIPYDIEQMINERVLSIWFMDDGNTDWTYRKGIKKYETAMPQCKISSESFSIDENIKLKNILENKYGLISNISYKKRNNKEQPYLRINCESSLKLIRIAKAFAPNDMSYKISEEQYLCHKNKIFDKETIRIEFENRHNIF